jgi:hypothetical protein
MLNSSVIGIKDRMATVVRSRAHGAPHLLIGPGTWMLYLLMCYQGYYYFIGTAVLKLLFTPIRMLHCFGSPSHLLRSKPTYTRRSKSAHVCAMNSNDSSETGLASPPAAELDWPCDKKLRTSAWNSTYAA